MLTTASRAAAAVTVAGTVACLLAFGGTLDRSAPSLLLAKQSMEAESTLSWLPAGSDVRCGEWPSDAYEAKLEALGVRTEGLGWQCADYTTTDTLNPKKSKKYGGEVTPAACKAWCSEEHDPSDAVTGEWCCQYTPSSRGAGGECTWTDGAAIYTQAECVQRGGACEKPLAYEACSFAGQFAPLAPLTCKRGERNGLLGSFKAPTLNSCSQLCASMNATSSGCAAFGYSDHEALCGRYSCELFFQCKAASKPSDDGFEFYGKKPRASGARLALSSTATSLAARARFPEQMGAPLGMVVYARAAPPVLALGASPKFSESVEYECDPSNGKKADDAMKIAGDWINSCSQICLPKAFWGPAAKRGVVHGKCKENGCGTFVAARKYAGVPYNIYNCTCPAQNASALYVCPSDAEGGESPATSGDAPALEC